MLLLLAFVYASFGVYQSMPSQILLNHNKMVLLDPHAGGPAMYYGRRYCYASDVACCLKYEEDLDKSASLVGKLRFALVQTGFSWIW